jgi:hypothetical protein
MRPVPESIIAAGRGNDDPDRRIIAMLSARQNARFLESCCSKTAASEGPVDDSRIISLR